MKKVKSANKTTFKKKENEIDSIELKIRETFLKPTSCSIEEKLNLIKRYLEGTPKYLNELKFFLKENDTELYKKYAECFKNNPGVHVAFGIIPENVEKIEIKKVHSLKPVLHTIKQKKVDYKKKIARINKKEVRQKFKDKQEQKKEYENKLNKIHAKIKKSN